MEFRSDFSLLDLEELHAPSTTSQTLLAAVVRQRYCLQSVGQYRLENELLSKAWTITDAASGEVAFRVRGKKVDWYRSKRELVDESGNTVLYMEEQPWALKNVWKAFAPGESDSPLYTLKSTNAFSFKPRVSIFLPSNTAQKQPDYTIEGGFLAKKCRIYFGDELVAEVTREASLKNIIITKTKGTQEQHIDMILFRYVRGDHRCVSTLKRSAHCSSARRRFKAVLNIFHPNLRTCGLASRPIYIISRTFPGHKNQCNELQQANMKLAWTATCEYSYWTREISAHAIRLVR